MTTLYFEHDNKFPIAICNYEMILEIDDVPAKHFYSITSPSFSLSIKPGPHKFVVRDVGKDGQLQSKSNVVLCDTLPGQSLSLFSKSYAIYNKLTERVRHCKQWRLFTDGGDGDHVKKPKSSSRSRLVVGPNRKFIKDKD